MPFYWELFYVCKHRTLQQSGSFSEDACVVTKTALPIQNAHFSIYYLDILHFSILETTIKPFTYLPECFHTRELINLLTAFCFKEVHCA